MGMKIRSDTEQEMMQAAAMYSKNKEVVVLGEHKNDVWLNQVADQPAKKRLKEKRESKTTPKAVVKAKPSAKTKTKAKADVKTKTKVKADVKVKTKAKASVKVKTKTKTKAKKK